jgi:hypothetical protein
MKIADQRNVDAHVGDARRNLRHSGRSLFVVDCNPNELGAGVGKIDHLGSSFGGIGGIGVRHRLNDDGMAYADSNATDPNRYCFSAAISCHDGILPGSKAKANSTEHPNGERRRRRCSCRDARLYFPALPTTIPIKPGSQCPPIPLHRAARDAAGA